MCLLCGHDRSKPSGICLLLQEKVAVHEHRLAWLSSAAASANINDQLTTTNIIRIREGENENDWTPENNSRPRGTGWLDHVTHCFHIPPHTARTTTPFLRALRTQASVAAFERVIIFYLKIVQFCGIAVRENSIRDWQQPIVIWQESSSLLLYLVYKTKPLELILLFAPTPPGSLSQNFPAIFGTGDVLLSHVSQPKFSRKILGQETFGDYSLRFSPQNSPEILERETLLHEITRDLKLLGNFGTVRPKFSGKFWNEFFLIISYSKFLEISFTRNFLRNLEQELWASNF